MQAKVDCCLCRALDPLVGAMMGAEASHLLCWACGHLMEATLQSKTGYQACSHLVHVTMQNEFSHQLCWA